MKEVEIISKRKRKEKHFLREDGTIVARVYPDDVHYLKNGNYEEIDNSLVKRKGVYKNRKNDYQVSYKENTQDSFLRMEKGDDFLEMKLKEASNVTAKKTRKKAEISYQNILEGIDIEYQTLPTKVKETIILQNQESSRRDLSFFVNTNLTLSLDKNQILAKKGEEVIFTIDTPYMEDREGKTNYDIFYSLEEKEEGYEIGLQLDHEWLTFGEVKYPVRIDPTITNQSQKGNVYDTYIYPGDTGVDRNKEPVLKAGVEKVNGENRINRTLIKFDLPEIGTGSEVIGATLTLCGYPLISATGNETPKIIEIHRVTAPWTEETANWENMSNNYDQRIDAIQFVNRSRIENGVIIPQYTSNPYGDITDLVKHWYKDTPNYGILIKSEKEEYIDEAYPAFYSKNHSIENANPEPVLTIAYRNQSGLENYYDYKSQSFTDGTTYSNTYNGNLVGVFKLASTIGSQLPATLSLIYNTNDVIVKKNGFQFNLSQTLKEIMIDNHQYYEYVDGDGTTHYFQNKKHRVLKPGKTEPTIDDILNPNYDEDNWYETREYCGDEDGLMLKLEKEGNQFIITDKYQNRMIFSKNKETDELYFLKGLEDVSKNQIQITYNENNKIIKVIDSSNEEIRIDYSTNNIIKVMSSSTESTIGITDNKVNYITTQNGTTTFDYNSKNIISSITDVNDTKVIYEYYDEIPYRIKKITQYGLNEALGKSLTFQYGFNETSMIDNKNRTNTILFNSSGNKISSNTLGREEDLNHAYSTFYTVSENASDRYYEKNKPLNSTSLFKYIKNYIKNSSFETDMDYFQNAGEIEMSFSTDCSVSGNRSLKVVGRGNRPMIGQAIIEIEEADYYTFSGYFKNDKPFTLQLFYYGENGIIETSKIIEKSEDFKRQDLSIYYSPEASSMLAFRMLFGEESVTYIDDIQLEEGEVANHYNIVENSDFSNGLSDWLLDPIDASKTDTYQVVKFHDNKNTALKINLSNSKSVGKKLPIQGVAGDLYDISFWLKNEGIFSDGFYVRNYISIEYEPVDETQEQYPIVDGTFIPNKKWQFLNYKSVAPYDYKSITIHFYHANQFNEMYLTNLSFYKDLNTTYYDYDTYGNLISTNDTSNARSTFNYDKNNQLIEATTPKGKKFKFEYDQVVTDRVVNAISSEGISNQIKYDSFGNPISTKISKRFDYPLANFYPIVDPELSANINLTTGTYKIRSRGTEKYLKAEYSNVFLESDTCSNTIWDVKRIGDQFKIIHSILPTYSLEYLSNAVILNDSDSNNLFILEENKNGSYYMKSETGNRYVKSNGTSLEMTSLIVDDPNFEFYFEIPEEEFMETTATYTEDGKFLTSVTDSNLNRTEYDTDEVTGLTKSMTNAKKQTTRYTYNEKKQITSVTQGKKTVNYTYNDKNLLEKIVQGNKEYKFTYDEFLNTKKVSIGDHIVLVYNNYEPNNGNLQSTVYGNQDEVFFAYDEFDRLSYLERMDQFHNFKYDSNGNLAKIISEDKRIRRDTDPVLPITTKYTYDEADRVKEYTKADFQINYQYDKDNNVTNKKYQFNDQIHLVENKFNRSSELTQTKLDDQKVNYEYDNLGRLKKKEINDTYQTEYEYVKKGKRTSNLVKSIRNGENEYRYQYDKLNNITHIFYHNKLLNFYEYDDYNELIKEENYDTNEKIEYIYDNSGNLLEKTTKNLETNDIIATDTYQYTNPDWEDQLTKFNDQEITYDAIGNPLSIGNSITMDWINGRSLKNYMDTNKNLDISYRYNKDGIREEKRVNGTVTKYHLENSSIIYEQRGNDIIYYLYDLTGLVGLKYHDNTYYYLKNLQGDIIGILDQDYNQVVTYEYDSWGKLLSIKDENQNEITDENHIGIINSFRYRGYYYDTETDLYYLNSRYYNPTWYRFLNADGMLIQNNKILGNNLYQYAYNNSINFIDESGHFGKFINGIVNNFKKAVNKTVDVALSPLKYAARGIWKQVVNVLDSIGMKTSAEMLNHSIQNNPSDLTYTDGSRIVNQIKNDSTFTEIVNEAIDNSLNGNINFDKWTEFETTTDLHGSLHGSHVMINGTMNDGCASLNVTITDRYDFDYSGGYFSENDIIKNFIFTVGNNLAWSDQFLGVVQNYDVTITFDYNICP